MTGPESTAPRTRDTRTTFAGTASALVEEDLSVALVYAEISGQLFGDVERRHPDRVVNVGIREQLLVNVGAGLALTGMRPIVHTFASFLVERAFEQLKLGFGHQDVGGVLVGTGASYDYASAGRTHQAPGDVALMDTLADWTIHVPGHADEVEQALRSAVAGSGRDYLRVEARQNATAYPVTGRLHRLRSGSRATVLAVGRMLDPVLAAVEGLDVTVLYANTIRPFDERGLREAATAQSAASGRGHADVVLVEPYLAGTSARVVSEALTELPHRLRSLGVGREEVRRYGGLRDHDRAHGLDAPGLRASVSAFVGREGAVA